MTNTNKNLIPVIRIGYCIKNAINSRKFTNLSFILGGYLILLSNHYLIHLSNAMVQLFFLALNLDTSISRFAHTWRQKADSAEAHEKVSLKDS